MKRFYVAVLIQKNFEITLMKNNWKFAVKTWRNPGMLEPCCLKNKESVKPTFLNIFCIRSVREGNVFS